MKKGDMFITKNKDKFYKFVGRAGIDVVLSPMEESDEQVLIYTPAEFEKLVAYGHFRKLYPTGIKVKNKE